MSKYKSALLQKLEANDMTDETGVSHDNGFDYMNHLFGFCGCGNPNATLKYTFDALNNIHEVTETWDDINSEAFKTALDKRENQFNGDIGAMYFIWYRLDDLGLLEHGGSVPGWLTDKGKLWLDALREVTETL